MTAVNLVQTNGQQVFTTSLIVAEAYGKAHDKVLRSIRAMLNHEDAEIKKFAVANFGDISYMDVMNRPQAAYRVTEDGFLELAMSFTGDAARKTRIRFIKAFRTALDHIAAQRAELITGALKTLQPPATLQALEDAYHTEMRTVHDKIIAMKVQYAPTSPRSAFLEELLLHAHTRHELLQAKVRAAQLEYDLATTKLEMRLQSLPLPLTLC